MDELLSEFLIETQKRLAVIDEDLAALRADPGNADVQKRILDVLHTIKGASVMLGLRRLEAMAQSGENVLTKARAKKIILSTDGAARVLDAVETIRRIQRAVATTGTEPAGDDGDLVGDLKMIAAGQPLVRPEPIAPPPKPEAPAASPPPTERGALPAVHRTTSAIQPSIPIPIERVVRMTGLVGELVAARNTLSYVLRDQLDPAIEEPLRRLDHVTSDLGAAFTATRNQFGEEVSGGLPAIDIQRIISVAAAGQYFAIPQRSIVELVRLVPGARRVASDEVRVLRLRERKYPWVRLASVLKLRDLPRAPGTREIIVMMGGADGPFGLAVDHVFDGEEVVVQPLAPVAQNNPLLGGTTLLGDGNVALVLDPKEVSAAVTRHRLALQSARAQLETR